MAGMKTPSTTLSHNSPTTPHPSFPIAQIKERLKAAAASIALAVGLAKDLDWAGDEAAHPEGSEEKALARTRDEIDDALARMVVEAMAAGRFRAVKSRSLYLLCAMAALLRGETSEALRVIDRLQEFPSEDGEAEGEVESFPDAFAWDTYLRVTALAELAEKYPGHLRYSARQMHGWPMIVSHDEDYLPEFQHIATHLEVGAACPKS